MRTAALVFIDGSSGNVTCSNTTSIFPTPTLESHVRRSFRPAPLPVFSPSPNTTSSLAISYLLSSKLVDQIAAATKRRNTPQRDESRRRRNRRRGSPPNTSSFISFQPQRRRRQPRSKPPPFLPPVIRDMRPRTYQPPSTDNVYSFPTSGVLS